MRSKKCKVCKTPFEPQSNSQLVYSPECAVEWVAVQREKLEKARIKKRRQEFLDNDRPYWLQKAQQAFNAYIRARDMAAGRPCVSCGRHHTGQYHAGHYRPVGGRSGGALRFSEINCWLQCSVCNNHLSGALVDYRIELIKRIGLELVEWLEGPHPPRKWKVPELKALVKYYRQAKKEAEQYQPPENF